MKRLFRAGCVAGLICAALLTGCGSSDGKDAVSVQQVSDLTTVNVSGNNRYSGIVEAQKIQKINKSGKKEVKRVYVKEGDTVRKGETLFTYDTASIQLEIDTAALELQRMQSEIKSYDTQIADLEKERRSASASDKLSYSLEIQEAQLNKAEAQYNYQKKQQSYEKLKKSINNTAVRAKINGVVQSVNEGDSDEENSAFITILQTGSYRVKGTANEMNVGTLTEGDAVQVISRIDESEIWKGTISRINTDGKSESSSEQEDYSDSESGESSTKYSFYVKLDDSSGLMLGQHVYVQVGEASDEAPEGFKLSSAYLAQEEDESWYVWMSKRGKLVKQTVTVGDYSEFDDTYVILDGLSEEDYIAFPEEGLSEGDKTVEYDGAMDEDTGAEETGENGGEEGWTEGEVPAIGGAVG